MVPEAQGHLERALALLPAAPTRERVHCGGHAACARRPLARRLRAVGRVAARPPARRAGAAVGAPVGLLPRRRDQPARPPGACAARVGRGRSAVSARAGAARVRPGGEQPAGAGRRGGPARAGARCPLAVGDPCGGARDGDAGPLRRRRRPGCASTSGTGPKATATPATCGGTWRCFASRGSTTPACCGWSTRIWPAMPCRSRCSASTRPRCCGDCTCWASTCASAAPHLVAAGTWPTTAPATTPSTTCTRCWRCWRPTTARAPSTGWRAAPRARWPPTTRRAATTRWRARSARR